MVRLPATSRTYRAIVGHEVWTTEGHLLAVVADLLQGSNWQRAQASSKQRIPRPDPIPRPGRSPKGVHRTTLTPDQIAARLRAQRRAQ